MNSLHDKLLNYYADTLTERVIRECSFNYLIKWGKIYEVTYEYTFGKGEYTDRTQYHTIHKHYKNIYKRIIDEGSAFDAGGEHLNRGNIFDERLFNLSRYVYNSVANLMNAPEAEIIDESKNSEIETLSEAPHCSEIISKRTGVNIVGAMLFFVIANNSYGQELTVLTSEPKERSKFPANFFSNTMKTLDNRMLYQLFSTLILNCFKNELTKRIKDMRSTVSKKSKGYKMAFEKFSQFVSTKDNSVSVLDLLLDFCENDSYSTLSVELQCLDELKNKILPLCEHYLDKYYTKKNSVYDESVLYMDNATVEKYKQEYEKKTPGTPVKQIQSKIALGISNLIHVYLHESKKAVLVALTKLPAFCEGIRKTHEQLPFEAFTKNSIEDL